MNDDPTVVASTDWEARLHAALDSLGPYAERFINTWIPVQIAIILIAYLIASFASRWFTPPFEDRLRRIHRQPRLVRVLVLILRRLDWIIFAILLWCAAEVLADLTRLSRSTLLTVAANLATAWVIISIVARLIRNRSISSIVAVAAWGLAALNIVGFLPETLAFLDQTIFSVGQLRVSLLLIAKAVILLAVLLWLAGIVGDFLEQRIRHGLELSPTAQVLLSKFVKGVLIVGALVVVLRATEVDLTTLAVFSGAIGIGIGLGLQKVASNLISGVIILMDRSIKPGDVITVGETFGWITSLKARYVSVVTRDGVEFLIPNETFVTDRVINWSYSDKAIRLEIKFGVSYESDPHLVRKIAAEAIVGLPRVINHQPPICHIIGFGDSSLDFVLRFWIADPQEGLTNVRGAAFLALWDALKAAGIRIPYPHRDVILHRSPQSSDNFAT
jgi:small-conductance mechanosensitive channel